MTYLYAILLGLVQGITEFLPISSSGHLALLQNLFRIEEADLCFDIMLHLGTLFAVCAAYLRDVRDLIWGGFGLLGWGHDRRRKNPAAKKRRRMAILVLAATVPTALGLLLKSSVETLSGNTIVVALMLIITGFVLKFSDSRSRGRREEESMSVLDGILIGLAQALAVLPGISRAGLTISAGRLRGFSSEYAVKYSFLISIPVVIGAALLEVFDMITAGIDTALLPYYLVGMLVSAVSGYFCIRMVRNLAARSKFGWFAYYCWGAAIVALVLTLVA